MLHAIVTILFIEMKDALRVGTCAELVPALDQIGIQIRKVMRLAIKNDPQRLIFVRDGLVATFDVDDGESSYSQTNPRLDVEPVTIRSAVDNGPGHRFDDLLVGDYVIRI